MFSINSLPVCVESEVKEKARALMAENDFGPGEYNPHNVHAFTFGNEYGVLGTAIGGHLQEALDNAVDNDLLDCQLMSEEDYKEYSENGWDDSYITAGNASEPFWSEYLWVYEHPTE